MDFQTSNGDCLEYEIYGATQNLMPVMEAASLLPRHPELLGHSEGFFEAVVRIGSELFPGLHWIVAHDSSGPAILWPVQLVIESDSRLGTRALYSLNHYEVPIVDMQCRERLPANALMRAMLRFVHSHLRPDVIRLRELRTGSPWLDVLHSTHADRLSQGAGASLISTEASYDIWLGKQSRNMRGQLRQAEKRLAARGVISVHTKTSPADVVESFSRFVELEAMGYKKSLGALRLWPSDREAISAAMGVHALRGEARVDELYCNGILAASQFGFVRNSCFYLLKVAYNEDYSECSPGALLIAHLASDLCGSVVTGIDCCIQQPWHARWHPRVVTTSVATLDNVRTWRGASLRLGRKLRSLGRSPGSATSG